jgi:beta-aspartyl-dipeptidase (metallo-type)
VSGEASSDLKLIRGVDVYAPEPLGRRDLLLGGGRVLAVGQGIAPPSGVGVERVEDRDLIAIPGLVDLHVHFAGAGGEGGPATRTPELSAAALLAGGTTTAVGCLGADGVTRTISALLMKAKGLREEGVSAWIYTGAYQVPLPTLLGDVAEDLSFVEEVVGVGEVAVADHRSSHLSVDELVRLASRARIGGMLGGKAGIVHLHLGDGAGPFDLVDQAVERSELRHSQFLPTHVNRSRAVFEDARRYATRGAVDITTSAYVAFPDEEVKPSRCLATLLGDDAVPAQHVTMSSDGGGSLPRFDDQGVLQGSDVGDPATLLAELREAVTGEGLSLERALPSVTSTPAEILKLRRKGRLAPGMDADVVLLDRELGIRHVMAAGEWRWGPPSGGSR